MRYIDNKKITKEIGRLNKKKASQKSDIPIKTIKENSDIFSNSLGETINITIKTSKNFFVCWLHPGETIYQILCLTVHCHCIF